MIRWAVFVSGTGSNLENFLNLEEELPHQSIVWVHADRPCPALEKAKARAKPTSCYSPREESFVERLLTELKQAQVDAIFLMGYMRILPAEFLEAFEGLVLNIHPSLLPRYKGLKAMERSFEAGDQMGVTLHEVIPELDSGPVIQQAILENPPKDWEAVVEAMHRLEHELVRRYLRQKEAELEMRA